MANQAYTILKRQVLSLQLEPGASVSEGELAARLGMSKTPVREALARLRRDGLVDSAPRSGHQITPVTVKDARDLFEVRTVLEGEAAAGAARRGSDVEHLRDLDALCGRRYDPGEPGSIADFLEVNTAFHLAVAQLGGNRRLCEHLAQVLEQLERYMHIGLALRLRDEEIAHEHHDLLLAIASGDVEKAREIAVEQSRASHRMVIDGLISTDAIQSANISAVLRPLTARPSV